MTPQPRRRALVLAATPELDFAAGSFIAGFLRHNPSYDGDLILLQDGLTGGAKAALSQLSPRLIIRDVPQSALRARLAGRDLGKLHPMQLAKFALFDLARDYDALVWCDIDILVRGEISHLWHIDGIGWRPLPEKALGRRARKLRKLGPDLAPPPFPNAGVLTLDAGAVRKAGLGADDLFRLAAEVCDKIGPESLDEYTLHQLVWRGTLALSPLDLADNHPVAAAGSEAARLLHSIGPEKFWTATPLRLTCPDWVENLRQWRAAGGRDAPPPQLYLREAPVSPSEALAQARSRALWRRLWPLLGPEIPDGFWPDLREDRPFVRLYLKGVDTALRVELTPIDEGLSFDCAVTLDRTRPVEADLAPPLARAMASLGLTAHEGRRLLRFGGVIEADALPHRLSEIRASLLKELS